MSFYYDIIENIRSSEIERNKSILISEGKLQTLRSETQARDYPEERDVRPEVKPMPFIYSPGAGPLACA